MRPSGPSPFSTLTKSANVRAPCPLFPATIPHKRDLSLVGKKDFRDLIHPWIECRYLERFLQCRCETGILTRGNRRRSPTGRTSSLSCHRSRNAGLQRQSLGDGGHSVR